MSKPRALYLLLALAGLAPSPLFCAPGKADAPETQVGYAAFRLVRTRNLFDPDRRPIRPETPASTVARGPVAKGPPYIAVTGTMVTPEKKLAFFSGSSADYGKVLGLHDKIGDFTVRDITDARVELDLHGKPVTVQVGRQIGLDGASLVAAQAPAPAPDTASSSSPAAGGTDNSPEAVTRRMMERRQKETSK